MVKNNKFDYYILKKHYKSFGYEDIRTPEGEVTAKILFPLYHPHNFVEIQDLKSKSVFFIQKSQSFFYKKFILTNSSGNVLAVIRVGKPPFLRNKAYLKTNNTLKKYIATGNLKRRSYHIINIIDNHVIAYVCDLKNSGILSKGINDLTKYYCIKIYKSKETPLILVSFAISINILRRRGVSNISGIERRIARLRPFGLGKKECIFN